MSQMKMLGYQADYRSHHVDLSRSFVTIIAVLGCQTSFNAFPEALYKLIQQLLLFPDV